MKTPTGGDNRRSRLNSTQGDWGQSGFTNFSIRERSLYGGERTQSRDTELEDESYLGLDQMCRRNGGDR